MSNLLAEQGTLSRVGKKIVPIPQGVEVALQGATLTARGTRGSLSVALSPLLETRHLEEGISVTPKKHSRGDAKRCREMWGTVRQNIEQAIVGVSQGFKKQLSFDGVGYRAQVEGKTLKLSLGYSHDILFPIPDGMAISVGAERTIIVEGHDKQRVGEVASRIRAFRPVEPYKGKGVRYSGAFVYRKEGKKK